MLPITTVTENAVSQFIGPLRQLLEESHVRDEFLEQLERERAAETAFRQRGNLATTWPTGHPLLAGLLAYERWIAGQPLETAAKGLASTAFKILQLKADWIGCERWLAPRLLGDAFYGLAFEFTVARHFASKGYRVEYLAAKAAEGPAQAKGPDIVVHAKDDIFIECTVGANSAGQQVPVRDVEGLAQTILRHMIRQQVFRLVVIESDGRFEGRDTDQIAAAVKQHLSETEAVNLDLLDGRYHVAIEHGGSAETPLTRRELDRLRGRLFEYPARWDNVRSLPGALFVPNRFVMRGVTIGSKQRNTVLLRLVKSVADKGPQLVKGAPNIVAAGFGCPFRDEQAEVPNLQNALRSATESVLRNSSRISGVLYMFRLSELDDAPGRRIGELPWDRSRTFSIRNAHPDTVALPSNFRMA